MNKTDVIHPKQRGKLVISRGTDLGNGYCEVPQSWLQEKLADLADDARVVYNGRCIISVEYIGTAWRATAVYSKTLQEFKL